MMIDLEFYANFLISWVGIIGKRSFGRSPGEQRTFDARFLSGKPYLARTPPSGGVYGLTLAHTKLHLYGAILEGIALTRDSCNAGILGAAICAATGSGAHKHFEGVCADMTKETGLVEPGMRRMRRITGTI